MVVASTESERLGLAYTRLHEQVKGPVLFLLHSLKHGEMLTLWK